MVVQAGHSQAIRATAQSDRFIVTGGEDRLVKLWTKDGRVVRTFVGHRGAIDGVLVSPDEQRIVSWANDDILDEHVVRVWSSDGSSERVLIDADEDHRSVYGAWFVGDELFVAIDRTIEVWRERHLYTIDLDGDADLEAARDLVVGDDGLTLTVADQYQSALFSRAAPSEHFRFVETTSTKARDRVVDKGIVARLPSAAQEGVTAVAFHPRGDTFAVGFASGLVQHWSVDGRLLRVLLRGGASVGYLAFAPRGDRLVATAGKTVSCFTLSTQSMSRFDVGGSVVGVAWAPTSDRVVLAVADSGQAEIRAMGDDASGALLRTLPAPDRRVSAVAWSARDVIAVGQDSPYGDQLSLLRPDGSVLRSFTLAEDSGGVLALAFSPDGDVLASGDLSSRVSLWTADGAPIARLTGHTFGVSAVAWSPDGTTLASSSWDGDARLWSRDGSLLRAFVGHSDVVSDIAFNGSLVLSGSRDTTFRLWRADNGEHVAFTTVGDDWIMFDDRGYFDAARAGGKRLAVVSGTTLYGVDQFAARTNRPDLLLARLQTGSEGLRASYEARHKRRLKRLGLADVETKELHIPTAQLRGAEQDGKHVAFQIACHDDHAALARVTVWINDVPVVERAVSGADAVVDERVELSHGDNKIEAACLDATGAESYRATQSFSYAPATPGALYVIAVGVSRYAREELALAYAAKDARDVAALLQTRAGFTAIHTTVLTDDDVTAEGLAAAKAALAAATPDDMVVLFIAGHGMHDDAGQYFFLPSAADPNALAATALSFDDVEDLLVGIAPRRKLFLMDTCESGELDDTVVARAATTVAGRARGFRVPSAGSSASLPVPATGKAAPLGAQLLDRDRYIDNDLARRAGAVVFSSSRGGEASFESDAIENGFFTAAVKRSLTTKEADQNSDGEVSVAELRRFVSDAVAGMSSGQQNPTIDRDNLSITIALPLGP